MAIQYTATDFLNKLSQSNYSYTNAYKKKVCESNKDVETLQVDVAGLKKTMKDIGKSKGLSFNSGLDKLTIYYKKNVVESKGLNSKTRLEKHFSNLAKTYNSMNKDAEKISDSEIEKQMDKLEELFEKNEKDLKKIGLKKKDGKYVFDSEVFKKADGKVINRLLEGKDSFVNQADKIMRKIETRLDDLQYSVVERNLMRTTRYDKDEINLAYSFMFAKESMEKLSGISDGFLASEPLSETSKKEIENHFHSIFLLYENANDFDQEDCKKLKELFEDPETEAKLAKVGITVGEGVDGEKVLKYNEPDFDDPDVRNEFVSLFGENSEFTKKVTDCCNNAYHNIVKPEKIGVSIVDVYA